MDNNSIKPEGSLFVPKIDIKKKRHSSVLSPLPSINPRALKRLSGFVILLLILQYSQFKIPSIFGRMNLSATEDVDVEIRDKCKFVFLSVLQFKSLKMKSNNCVLDLNHLIEKMEK
jgi:hypothetical protein